MPPPAPPRPHPRRTAGWQQQPAVKRGTLDLGTSSFLPDTATVCLLGSACFEPHGQFVVTPDQQAANPTWRRVGIERDTARAIEKYGEHVASFDSGQGCANAVMNTSPESHMASRHPAVQVDLVGMLEFPQGLGYRSPRTTARLRRPESRRRRASCPPARSASCSGTGIRAGVPPRRRPALGRDSDGDDLATPGLPQACALHCRGDSWWTHRRRSRGWSRSRLPRGL